MNDQTSYAARQTLLAIKCLRFSMLFNMVLLCLFCFLTIWGVIRQPVYVAATSDIHPSLIEPAHASELYGLNFRLDEKKAELREETESVQVVKDGEKMIDVITDEMPLAYDKKEIIPLENR